MKRFHKLTAWLLTFAMLTALIPAFTFTANAEGAVTQPCNGDHTGWTKLSSYENTITTPGKYYLANDINNYGKDSPTIIKIECSDEVILCLNGKTLSAAVRRNQYSNVIRKSGSSGDAILILCDCVGTGKITANDENKGRLCAVDMYLATIHMYGGTITGLYQGINAYTFNIYGGSIIDNSIALSARTKCLSGSPVINGLEVGQNNGIITVGDLTEGAKIGVFTKDTSDDVLITEISSTEDAKYFYSEDSDRVIWNNDNTLYLHRHVYSEATCTTPATCICGDVQGEVDSEKHAPSEEWTFEDGKHYHKCLYGCDAHLEEDECSGERATCLEAAVCEVCSNIYEDINPDNHASDDVYAKKLSNDTHGVYYACCNALKTEETHTESVSATCGGAAYCSECKSAYGYYDSSNHEGELEYIVESNTSHSQNWTCCGVYEIRYESHELEYSVDEDNNTISAYCTDCGAEGFVKMTIADGIYNGYAFKATAEKSGIFYGWAPAHPEFTYCCEDGCKKAGTHTVAMTLGEKTISKEFHIDKRPLDFQYIRCHTKQYDGTRNATVTGAKLNGIVIYSKGADGFAEYDDVKDDVSLSWATLTALLPDSAIGYYETADVSGIALEGADKDNYTISESISGVTLQDNYGWDYSVDYIPLTIELKDQIIYGEGELEQDAYTISLDDRFEISGIVLYDDGYGKVDADTSNLKVMHNGQDWTEYVTYTVYKANLLKVCEGHITDENGFCSTGSCNAYDVPMLITETDEYDNEISFYQIENAGQLYWFAEQVNVYYNTSINARLVNDIYVNNDLTAENLREWTPIGGRYSSYMGMFDGNGYSISGLYFNNPDADYVGLFGSTDYGYTIKNIHIKNSYFNGNNCVGALCGYAGSNISYCTASADVTVNGNSDVGGLVGSSSYGELKNCYSLAAVDSDGLVGGLVGRNCLAILGCYTNQNSIYGNNNENYGGSVTNSYYLSAEETEDGGKTAVQFENGEVAYLLQSGIVGEPIYDEEWNEIGTTEPEFIWGQRIGVEKYPSMFSSRVYKDEHNGTYAYRNEIDGFDIIYLDKDKKAATVVFDEAGTYTVVFADYGENNVLSNVETIEVTVTEPKAVLVMSAKTFTLGENDKIMLWSDLTNLVPKCEAYVQSASM